MSSEEEEDVGFIEAEEIESDFDPECDHDWEYGQCINCGQIHEPDDFSGATPGDR